MFETVRGDEINNIYEQTLPSHIWLVKVRGVYVSATQKHISYSKMHTTIS